MKKPKEKRQHFTFYRSFYEAIKLIPDKGQQADLYNAIFELSLNFNEPENEDKLNQLAWLLIKPNVVKSCINYSNGLQRKRSEPKNRSGSACSESEANPSRDIDKELDKDKDLDKEKDKNNKSPEFSAEPENVGSQPPAKKETKLSPEAIELTQYFYDQLMHYVAPAAYKNKPPNLESWAKDVDKLLRIDKAPYADVKRVINWAIRDDFWSKNILSANKLRKHYARLDMQSAPKKHLLRNGLAAEEERIDKMIKEMPDEFKELSSFLSN